MGAPILHPPLPGSGAFAAAVHTRLRADLDADRYESWCARIEVDRIDGELAVLSVPTKFLQSWLQSHYADCILQAATAADPRIRRVEIAIRSTSRASLLPTVPAPIVSAPPLPSRASPEAISEPVPPPPPPMSIECSPLDPRLTFERFHVHAGNQLAHAAARRIARAIQRAGGQQGPSHAPVYNPLFVHAAVGLGKTHLLQALAAEAAALSGAGRIVYLTAENFMYRFVLALRAQAPLAFRQRLRTVDALLIDDVQFVQGRSIQAEFCQTMDALLEAGVPTVLAADRSPAELESLDERTRSRLSGGLVVDMGPLDGPTRVRLLEARIADIQRDFPWFGLSDAVITGIAASIDGNGRDLDGAVNRLVAHASLTGAHRQVAMEMTVEAAQAAVRDLIRTRQPRPPKIEDIQRLVAAHYGITRTDLLSSRRTANVVRPRQLAMYLAKVTTLRSLPEIGRRFGGRDHTTVLHAVRKYEGLVATDRAIADEVTSLRSALVGA